MIFYTDQGDTPIIGTRKDELGLVREGVFGERVEKGESDDECGMTGIQSLPSNTRVMAKIRLSL